MVSHIQELSTSVIAKLRSGITITSVSQCVEELVLNAVDSGATNIAVRVDLEIYRIQVVDNGHGISEQDMKIIGSRYATSKCHDLEDIKYNLTKYGYRGEALASVIQVSGIVDISSRYKKSSKTFEKLFTYGKGQSTSLSKYSRPSCGTTITVQDFMYNMPVRRKIIKEAIDIEYIKSQIERIMLISHNVSISLKNDRNNCYILQIRKSNSLLNSFVQLFGKEHEENITEVYHSIDQLEIKGYISTQPHQTKNLQFVYINKRAVLHTKIHALVNELISRSSIIRNKIIPNSGVSGPGKVPSSPPKGLRFYPIYVLNVICSRSEYDICLEPKKTLVEFRDWEKVLLCVEEMILKFVKEENLTISMDDRFRRSEKEVFAVSDQISISHSSQAVLMAFSNTKGKSSSEEHQNNILERKLTISDLKHGVYGRPARRNNRLITGNECQEIKDNFNNELESFSLDEGDKNQDIIKDVEQKSCTETVQVVQGLCSTENDYNNLKSIYNNNAKISIQQSSLNALKQVITTVQQSNITNCDKVLSTKIDTQPSSLSSLKQLSTIDHQSNIKNCDKVAHQTDNHATVKPKRSSLEELRLVNEACSQNVNPNEFVTPTNKVIPSVSPPNRDINNTEETMDIYDSRKLIIHQINVPSNKKTQGVSHSLGKNYKETIKKKKILKTLHSFKFEKSTRNKSKEETILSTKVLDKNMIKKNHKDNCDNLIKIDDDFHFNSKSSTITNGIKNTFFNFDKTEDFSLDSIDVEDLLQDKKMCNVKPFIPHSTLNSKVNPLNKEEQTSNTASEIKKATKQFLLSEIDEGVKISFKEDRELNSISSECTKKISENLWNESSIPSAVRNNSKIANLTQPFRINNDGNQNNSIKISATNNYCNDFSMPEILRTQKFTVIQSDCNQVSTQSITSLLDITTNTGPFNMTGSFNSEIKNITSDTDMQTHTMSFSFKNGLPLEIGVPSSQVCNTSSKTENNSPVPKETQSNIENRNKENSLCLPVDDNIMIDLEIPEHHPKNAELPNSCEDTQMSDFPKHLDNDGQIQSLCIDPPQSSSLDMNIEVRHNEESTLDSLSSETKKNIIDFVSSDKSLSSFPRQSLSESIKKYAENCQFRFEGRILQIGPSDSLEKSNFVSQSSKESTSSINDTKQKSSETTSNNDPQLTSEAVTEAISTSTKTNETTKSTETINSKSTSWKRVMNGGENIYINLRTGNTSFVEPTLDSAPKWKANHSMGCPTLKIPITDEVDPLGLTRKDNAVDQCFSLSHGFEVFLPSKRKQPSEGTVDAKIKKIGHFNNIQNTVQEQQTLINDKEVVDCVKTFNGFRNLKSYNNTEIPVQQNYQPISSKTDEALSEFFEENFLMDDEFSKWGHTHIEKNQIDKEAGNSNGFLNFWENTENFAMDAEILGSGLEGKDQLSSYSNVKCYNIVHPYKFTREMLKSCKVFGQVDNKFIAITLPFNNISPHLMVLVDQHAADERIQLEKVLLQSYEIKTTSNGLQKKVLRSERIQTPIEASFRSDQVRLMKSFRDAFFEVGLEFTLVNETSVLFHCIPYCLVAKEPNERNTRRCQTAAFIIEAIVIELCENIRTLGGASHVEDEGVRPLPRPLSHVMNTIACRSAIKFGDALSLLECERLIGLLMECQLPFQCAHGRPSLIPIVDFNYLNLKKRNSKPNLKKLYSYS